MVLVNKPIIAVDIDDVLFPYVVELAKHYNDVNGTTLEPTDFHTYHFMEVFGCTEEEATAYVNALHESDYLHIKPMHGTQPALKKLAQHYELHIITSRPPAYEQKTRAWIDRHFPGTFSRIDLVGNPYDGTVVRTKVDLCQEIGAICLIDDQPKYIEQCAEKGTEAILFGAYAWSKAYELQPGITRCQDWQEVLEYFDVRNR